MADRSEKAEFTNMCMVTNGKGEFLVQNRKDPSWPGLCFPGGHVEAGESFVDSVVREVFEETGLTISNPVLCGIKQGKAKNDARYVVLLFKASDYSGELHSLSEGDVFWCGEEELSKYTLARDFEYMLRVFKDDSLSEMYYCQDGGEWQKRLL